MHDNEQGGFTLPNSLEVNAALRLAHARGDETLARELSHFRWDTAVGPERVQLTKVVELSTEPSRELAFLLLDAVSGHIEDAHPDDVATATGMLAGKGLLPGVTVGQVESLTPKPRAV